MLIIQTCCHAGFTCERGFTLLTDVSSALKGSKKTSQSIREFSYILSTHLLKQVCVSLDRKKNIGLTIGNTLQIQTNETIMR